MVLTVTINPLLERRYYYKNTELNLQNRNGRRELKAGGKGINVSRQLNILGADNNAFTFLGGANGKILRDILAEEKIKTMSVKTAGETRDGAVIIDESANSLTAYFGPNTVVSAAEAEEFKDKLDKMIQNCEIVVFSGSSPCGEADSIFPYGIELANRYDKISVCDTYGAHLKKCIEKAPTILHNNFEELETSLNRRFSGEPEKLSFLDELYSAGIKQAYLTDGGGVGYASNFDFHFKFESPEIDYVDATGSGDSFAAGIVYGWHNDLTFNEGLTIAAALGAINASRFEVCEVKLDDIKSVSKEVKIIPVGKIMKTLDVTPR